MFKKAWREPGKDEKKCLVAFRGYLRANPIRSGRGRGRHGEGRPGGGRPAHSWRAAIGPGVGRTGMRVIPA